MENKIKNRYSEDFKKSTDSNLTIKTLHTVFKNRNYPKSLIFHSDRGSQYTSL